MPMQRSRAMIFTDPPNQIRDTSAGKHEDTKTRRSHKAAHPPEECPQITQINPDGRLSTKELARRSRRLTQMANRAPEFSTQRRGGAESSSQGLIIRRDPGRQTARNRWARLPFRSQAIITGVRPSGLRSRRAQASPFPLFKNIREIHEPPLQEGTRQAESTRHWRVGRWGDRS